MQAEYQDYSFDDGFLSIGKSIILADGDTRGYNYTKVKENVHAESMSPALQIFLFVCVGLCISACCVCVVMSALQGSEGFNDLFNDDSNPRSNVANLE